MMMTISLHVSAQLTSRNRKCSNIRIHKEQWL